MSDQQARFRPGDLVDVVFRRAVVDSVHSGGRLTLVHVEEEFHGMAPDATDVEVTLVGHVEREEATGGWRV